MSCCPENLYFTEEPDELCDKTPNAMYDTLPSISAGMYACPENTDFGEEHERCDGTPNTMYDSQASISACTENAVLYRRAR